MAPWYWTETINQMQQWDFGLWKPFSLFYGGISYYNTAQIHILTFVAYLRFLLQMLSELHVLNATLFKKTHGLEH